MAEGTRVLVTGVAGFLGANLLPRLLERQLGCDRDGAAQFGIEPLQSLQIDLRQPLRGELSACYPPGQLRDRGESDVFILGRQRSRLSLAAHKSVLLWACF